MKFSDLNKDKKKPQKIEKNQPEEVEAPIAPKKQPPAAVKASKPAKIEPKPQENLFTRLVSPAPASEAEELPEEAPAAPPTQRAEAARKAASNDLAPKSSGPLHVADAATRATYDKCIRLSKKIFNEIEKPGIVVYGELRSIALLLIEALNSHRYDLAALTRYSTAANYLYAHSANVAILSLNLAEGLGWEAKDMVQLVICSFLHDLGMLNYLNLINEPRPLTKEERIKIQKHPLDSVNLLDNISDMDPKLRDSVASIIVMHHERINGHGYPKGLHAEDISLPAQILGLCDAFEAMTHHRSWRDQILPHEVLKTLMRNTSQEFEPKLIKIFLDRLSLFPSGTYVQLSGGEIARVIETRHQFPTRPLIEIQLRPNRTRQDPPIPLDLLTAPLIHITKAVDETKLPTKDQKFLIQLEAGRWWLDAGNP